VTFPAAFKPLTKDDIAAVLSVSLRTIENWVQEGIVPPPAKIGNRVYWHPGVFYAWLEGRLTVAATDEEMSHALPSLSAACLAKRKKLQSPAKSGKTELEQLRSREQAKLESLLS